MKAQTTPRCAIKVHAARDEEKLPLPISQKLVFT